MGAALPLPLRLLLHTLIYEQQSAASNTYRLSDCPLGAKSQLARQGQDAEAYAEDNQALRSKLEVGFGSRANKMASCALDGAAPS